MHCKVAIKISIFASLNEELNSGKIGLGILLKVLPFKQYEPCFVWNE